MCSENSTRENSGEDQLLSASAAVGCPPSTAHSRRRGAAACAARDPVRPLCRGPQAAVHRGGGRGAQGQAAVVQGVHLPPHHRQLHGPGPPVAHPAAGPAPPQLPAHAAPATAAGVSSDAESSQDTSQGAAASLVVWCLACRPRGWLCLGNSDEWRRPLGSAPTQNAPSPLRCSLITLGNRSCQAHPVVLLVAKSSTCGRELPRCF